MKSYSQSINLIFLLLISAIATAQHVGINQNNPTNSLHITPVGSNDPLRRDGVQAYSVGDTSLLMINTQTGIVKYINAADFVSIISNGAGLGTDDQNIENLTLNGLTLTTFIEDGNSASVDLTAVSDSAITFLVNNTDTLFSNSSFIDSIVSVVNNNTDSMFTNQVFRDSITSVLFANADTLLYNSNFINNLRDSIDTDVDSVVLTGTVLAIYENGSNATVDLSSLTSASQTLSLLGSNLTLSDGGGVVSINDADADPTNEHNTSVSLAGDVLTVADGGGNKTANLSGLKDHDWYEVGGSTQPDNINDNIYTQGSVAVGAVSPDASSILDLSTTSKGALMPRMTEAQKNAITSPATGLLIFQTDQTAGFYYFDGTNWVPFGSSASAPSTAKTLIYTTNGF